MNDRVKSFLDKITTTAVEAISFGEVRDCRFGVFPDHNQNLFAWICLDVVQVPESEGSSNKVEALWAHTNDFDPMVYGWSNLEFSLITRDRQEAIDKIIAFLTEKVKGAGRVEVKYHRTPESGCSLPVLVGNSDGGELAQPVDLMGC